MEAKLVTRSKGQYSEILLIYSISINRVKFGADVIAVGDFQCKYDRRNVNRLLVKYVLLVCPQHLIDSWKH